MCEAKNYLLLSMSVVLFLFSSILCRKFRSEVARRRCISDVIGLACSSYTSPWFFLALVRSDEDRLRPTTRGLSVCLSVSPPREPASDNLDLEPESCSLLLDPGSNMRVLDPESGILVLDPASESRFRELRAVSETRATCCSMSGLM